MLADRKDITSRIAGRPLWWDEDGCPRYDPFHPDQCASIYAKETALVTIACQACGERFQVAFSYSGMGFGWEPINRDDLSKKPFPEAVLCRFTVEKKLSERVALLHYGDPPRHGCVGDTMNCEDVEVTEFWQQNASWKWERVPEFERPIAGLEGGGDS